MVGSVNQPHLRNPRPTLSNSRLTPELPVCVVPGLSIQRQTTPVTMYEIAIGKRKMLRKIALALDVLVEQHGQEQADHDAGDEEEDGEGHRVAQVAEEAVDCEELA